MASFGRFAMGDRLKCALENVTLTSEHHHVSIQCGSATAAPFVALLAGWLDGAQFDGVKIKGKLHGPRRHSRSGRVVARVF